MTIDIRNFILQSVNIEQYTHNVCTCIKYKDSAIIGWGGSGQNDKSELFSRLMHPWLEPLIFKCNWVNFKLLNDAKNQCPN